MEGTPKVVEFNVRMGDPETEAVLTRIDSDLVDLFVALGNKELDKFEIQINDKFATTVVLVAGGYPEAYEKGAEITGLGDTKDSVVFHAGTKLENGKVVTNGGRVLAVSSYGKDLNEALKKSYVNTAILDYDKKYFRSDLGFDLQKYL